MVAGCYRRTEYQADHRYSALVGIYFFVGAGEGDPRALLGQSKEERHLVGSFHVGFQQVKLSPHQFDLKQV